jgi:MOSC domain-containing protein YiiM
MKKKEPPAKIGKVYSINRSYQKGSQKKPVGYGYFKLGVGMAGDAHSNSAEPEFQVSLLAYEDYESHPYEVPLGNFGENITTKGIELKNLPIGTQIHIGKQVLLQIGQIGKECHSASALKDKQGVCLISSNGVFTYVRAEGEIFEGDEIRIIRPD